MHKGGKLIAGLLALAVCASGAWILLGPGGVEQPHVVVEVDGAVYCDYDLREVSGVIPISGPGGGENRLQVTEEGVYMERANCPDQICVKQGLIKDGSVPIVCLPNKVIVRIVGGVSEFDTAN